MTILETSSDRRAGATAFCWSRTRLRRAAIALGVAAMPCMFGLAATGPLAQSATLAWLAAAAWLAHGISRRCQFMHVGRIRRAHTQQPETAHDVAGEIQTFARGRAGKRLV